jgi:hypothetical protein
MAAPLIKYCVMAKILERQSVKYMFPAGKSRVLERHAASVDRRPAALGFYPGQFYRVLVRTNGCNYYFLRMSDAGIMILPSSVKATASNLIGRHLMRG